MSDGTRSSEAGQQELAELISKIWHNVIRQVNKVIQAHATFGFVRFEENMNPTLPEVVKALELVEFALNQFYQSGLLQYGEERDILNAKQCILNLKLLAVASKEKDQGEFERLIAVLKAQSKF